MYSLAFVNKVEKEKISTQCRSTVHPQQHIGKEVFTVGLLQIQQWSFLIENIYSKSANNICISNEKCIT